MDQAFLRLWRGRLLRLLIRLLRRDGMLRLLILLLWRDGLLRLLILLLWRDGLLRRNRLLRHHAGSKQRLMRAFIHQRFHRREFKIIQRERMGSRRLFPGIALLL